MKILKSTLLTPLWTSLLTSCASLILSSFSAHAMITDTEKSDSQEKHHIRLNEGGSLLLTENQLTLGEKKYRVENPSLAQANLDIEDINTLRLNAINGDVKSQIIFAALDESKKNVSNIVKDYEDIAQTSMIGNLVLGLLNDEGKICSLDSNKANSYYSQAQQKINQSKGLIIEFLKNKKDLDPKVSTRLQGLLKFYGEFTELDKPGGLELMKKSSLGEDRIAQFWLGNLYNPEISHGIFQFTDKEIKQAYQYYVQAAEQGNITAQYYAGSILLESGKFSAEEQKRNIQYLITAAENNHTRAQAKAGILLITGNKVAKDNNKGLQFLTKAGTQGVNEAQLDLGKIYENGLYGISANYDEAIKWYDQAQGQHQLVSESSQQFMYDGNLHNNLSKGLYAKVGSYNDVVVNVKRQTWKYKNDSYSLQRMINFQRTGIYYNTTTESAENSAAENKTYDNGHVYISASCYRTQSRSVTTFPNNTKQYGSWYNTGGKRVKLDSVMKITQNGSTTSISGGGVISASSLFMRPRYPEGTYTINNCYADSDGIILNGQRVIQF